MNKHKILSDMQDIFRNVFDQGDLLIKDETSSADIEDWDSLSQINLIVAMEKQFQIKFTLSDVRDLQNVGEMADLIARKLSQK